jgi:hypothetical protein
MCRIVDMSNIIRRLETSREVLISLNVIVSNLNILVERHELMDQLRSHRLSFLLFLLSAAVISRINPRAEALSPPPQESYQKRDLPVPIL